MFWVYMAGAFVAGFIAGKIDAIRCYLKWLKNA